MSSSAPVRAISLPPTSTSSPSFYARAVLASFGAMNRGRLRVELPGGAIQQFGADNESTAPLAPGVAAAAVVRVHRMEFFKKCVLQGDIGFAEAYLAGDWDTPDLTAVIGWFVLNHDSAPTLSGSRRARSLVLNLLRAANRLRHRLRPNSRRIARRNIAEHYDLSNDFFSLWLDPSMMYSAARWERDDATLLEAQITKNDALCRKLRLQSTDHVLEIGTGWGGWCVHAAQHYGCRITTVTLSQQQHDYAVRRVAAAGLSDRIEVRRQDYRDITGHYDKIVSIEMLEAVGHDYLPQFAAACHRLLKRDGLMALQFITCPDARYPQFRRGVDFIQKHIFPGSLLLSVNRLNHCLTAEGDFLLHQLEDMGRDYARTLRLWRDGFHAKLDAVRALGFDERFVRKWHYYLCYCEAAFALRNISVVQTVHTRPNNLNF